MRLRSGEILRLVDFVEAPLQSLEVEVVDHAGVPLSNGILSIRDRMAEAWRIVELGGSTLAYAPDRIPMPPERRLRNGRVTFPAVRQGFLELQLLSGGDRIHRFSVSVHPEPALEAPASGLRSRSVGAVDPVGQESQANRKSLLVVGVGPQP